MRTEIERIRDQLSRVMLGEAWHGPALMELLGRFDAQTAQKAIAPRRNSVWALTAHLEFWFDVVVRRLDGEARMVSSSEDWPKPDETTDAEWEEAVRSVLAAYERLDAFLAKMTDDELLDLVPGNTPLDKYMLVHGCTQHVAYHVGQIALADPGSS